MKKHLIVIAVAMSTQFGFAQKGIQPVIGINASTNMLDEDGIITKSLSISPGFEWNGRANFSVDLRYVKSENRNNCFFNDDKMNGFMGSLSFSYRMISTGKISPSIGFTAGSGMYTKTRVQNRINESNFKNVPLDEQRHDYDTYRFFLKGKFLLDVRLKYLSLNFGPTYNLFEARRLLLSEQKFSSTIINGMGLELGMVVPLTPRASVSRFNLPGRR
jgi:hypothetical protein